MVKSEQIAQQPPKELVNAKCQENDLFWRERRVTLLSS